MIFQNATAVAMKFHLDPVAVLEETDSFRTSIRFAALELALRWEREANARSGNK